MQKFNELLDFTDHADQVYQKSGTSQKRTVLKLCIEGFTVQNQKLTPIWSPVFDVLMDLQLSKFDPPKVVGKGSKTLAVPKVLTWTSGGGGGIRTLDTLRYTRFPSVRTRPLCDPSVFPMVTPNKLFINFFVRYDLGNDDTLSIFLCCLIIKPCSIKLLLDVVFFWFLFFLW